MCWVGMASFTGCSYVRVRLAASDDSVARCRRGAPPESGQLKTREEKKFASEGKIAL